MKKQQLLNPLLPQSSSPSGVNPQTSPQDFVLPRGNCPQCGKGKLDYNGLLELECPVCGFRSGGGEGCT